jgi:hypothetical protein
MSTESDVKAPVRVCNGCGKENYSASYSPNCAEKKLIDSMGICFDCAFWEVRAKLTHETVIDHYLYGVGDQPKGGKYNGMGGRRFDIEYFDGRVVTTYDLWAGGEIPERFRGRIPDTARFSGGASRGKAGDITCWDASTDQKP